MTVTSKLLWLSFVLSAMVLLSPSFTLGQNLSSEWESLYQKGQFEKLLASTGSLNSDEAKLYRAQAFYGLGLFGKAINQAKHVNAENISLFPRAKLVEALSRLNLGSYEQSLQVLHDLSGKQSNLRVQSEATLLKNQLLNFLTLEQRRLAYFATKDDHLRFDIIRSAFRFVDQSTATALVERFVLDDNNVLLKTQLRQALVQDSLIFNSAYSLSTPKGIAYTIGVVLPLYDQESPIFSVAQGLFNGLQLAAEEFNQEHSDKKIFLDFINSNDSTGTLNETLETRIWEKHYSAFFGPLFSSNARVVAERARQSQIPVITPLANSDTINVSNPFLFQLNPTFEKRGIAMADFAIQKGLDSVIVIAERGSLGMEEALAFQTQLQRRGGTVTAFILEDLEDKAYDLTEHMNFFSKDSLLVDSLYITPAEAVFYPVSGEAAAVMVELFMTDLEAINAEQTILGSEEWTQMDFPERQLNKFKIYAGQARAFSNSQKTESFFQVYLTRFGYEPDEFAALGYDAGTYLFTQLEKASNPAKLKDLLLKQAVFNGLSTHIYFGGAQINRLLNIQQISN